MCLKLQWAGNKSGRCGRIVGNSGMITSHVVCQCILYYNDSCDTELEHMILSDVRLLLLVSCNLIGQ